MRDTEPSERENWETCRWKKTIRTKTILSWMCCCWSEKEENATRKLSPWHGFVHLFRFGNKTTTIYTKANNANIQLPNISKINSWQNFPFKIQKGSKKRIHTVEKRENEEQITKPEKSVRAFMDLLCTINEGTKTLFEQKTAEKERISVGLARILVCVTSLNLLVVLVYT